MNHRNKANTVLLILWVIVGGVDAASALIGHDPTWVQVFCPLICLIMELLCNYAD